MVKVDSGNPSYNQKFKDCPPEKWSHLFRQKSCYLKGKVDITARYVIEAVDEAPVVFEAIGERLGYESVDDLIEVGYKLKKDEIDFVRRWLDRNKQDWNEPFSKLAALGKHGGNHGNQHTKKETCQDNNIILAKPVQGTSTTYTVARLKRDRPDLAERVINGELSPNAAAIEAGIRKKTKSIPIDSPESAIKGLLKVFSLEQLRKAINENYTQ